jgi:hypothetical protein
MEYSLPEFVTPIHDNSSGTVIYLRRPKCRCEDNIKIDLREQGFGSVD